AARDYTSAYASRQSLRERRREADSGRPVSRGVIYDMYAHAKALEAENRTPFAESFTVSFRDVVSDLDDQDADIVTGWLTTPSSVFREALRQAFDQYRAKGEVVESEAIALIWAYVSFDAYRSFGPLAGELAAQDEHRRYLVDTEVVIRTRDGASLSALVVRPRNSSAPLPTLFEFTINGSQNYAKECAAHGYVGVVAYSRGKRKGGSMVIPYQHDGDDARTVIAWIATQPWSDGRVGMYGQGYSGFTPWAAAKRPPAALKAIAVSASGVPGIDVPMAGSIFQNSSFRWALRMTGSKAPDAGGHGDDEQWRALDQRWYASGKRYRDMPRLYGKPNPIFIRWLNHPSYDRYWQKMGPYRKEFARIDIPVLTTTGYYAAGAPGDLYYFTQHHRYNPRADHMLVVGPYDEAMLQRGTSTALRGYQLDAAALVDLRELRYRWFNHVFKDEAAPSILSDTVNFEVMGANEWRHAPSLEAMAEERLKLYLRETASRPPMQQGRANAEFVPQTVNFLDRTDVAWTPPAELVGKQLADRNATTFVTEPFTQPTEFNGVFSGSFDFKVNKMDVDLNITLYELMADGEYVRLFSPAYEFRASYARDRVHRHLLKAGQRQVLTFASERLTSRQLQTGSRLVIVLGVNKRPDRESNYGTGKDVSEEAAADAKIPLKIQWYSDSYLDIPLRK
ncbi:MAG: CocE/NonD family hydrolase, partial [Pseudomonadota bacterium]|nr:CocE/NonD family hydrolase [Pseudomonadota bacterium]